MDEPDNNLMHGTAVALDGWAVIFRGPSGAGKSELALRLIHMGGLLVSDDQIELSERGGLIYAGPPAVIGGMMEVRGIGVVKVEHQERAPVALLVDLVPHEDVPRHPDAQL